MKTVVLRLDGYSKIVLTVIAIALVLIALRPFLPTELEAKPEVVDVNIKEIADLPATRFINNPLIANLYPIELRVEVTNADQIGQEVAYHLGN